MLALSTLLGLVGCGGAWLTPRGPVGCDDAGLVIEADRLELDIQGYDGPCTVESSPRTTSPASWIVGPDVSATVTGGPAVTASWSQSAWITRDYYRVDARGPGELNEDVTASVRCESCNVFTTGFLDLDADFALVETCGPISGTIRAGQVLFIPPLGNPGDFSGLDNLTREAGVALQIGLPAAVGAVELPAGSTRVTVEGCARGIDPVTPELITVHPVEPSRDWNGAIEVETTTRDDLQMFVYAQGERRNGRVVRWPDRLVFRPDRPFAANVRVTTDVRSSDALVTSHAFTTPSYDARLPEQRLTLELQGARLLGPSAPRILQTPLAIDLEADDDAWQLYLDNVCPLTYDESSDPETIELHVYDGPFGGVILRATLDGDALRQVSLEWPTGLPAVVDTIPTEIAHDPLGCNLLDR